MDEEERSLLARSDDNHRGGPSSSISPEIAIDNDPPVDEVALRKDSDASATEEARFE
ncbi:hypothetical protein BGZ81_003095, partial [Podila clonocystis]